MNPEFTILLFYKYVSIDNPEEVKDWQKKLCEDLGLKGRLIVAHEGINVTLEGTTENTEKYREELEKDPRFLDIHFKKSVGTGDAFRKLSVKVRPEIVSLHLEEDIDPNQITGKHLKPEELKKWYESGKEFYIIDMRNDYEYRVGHFKDSVLMPVQNFRDIPSALSHIEHLKGKTVVPVCTGGVRCEKASGLLVREGFSDVYQLDGGIVSYMEKFPTEEFKGTLYVFDKRVTMDFDSPEKHEVVGVCDKCATSTEKFANCRNKQCNKKILCCENCRLEDGTAFCGEKCKEFVLGKAPKVKKMQTAFPFVLQKVGYVVFFLLYKIFGRLTIRGQGNLEKEQGPFIFAFNHQHELDATLFPFVLPFNSKHSPFFTVAAAREKYKTFGWRGFFYGGFFFRMLGAYSVFSGQQNYAYALQTHEEILKKDHSICIFPEGKRTPDGALGPARGGLGYLVYATGAKVVPVAISGFYKLTLADFFSCKRKVTITVGTPLQFEISELATKEVFVETGERVMEEIRKMLQ
ncbi:MAG: rhodanese-related sulfurtransferase [Candidatus Zambryskibacteria bacterium]|nr:rhodanese-related sulfurtransferase [Candidatus Zambryskibacteria bacterium]